LIILAVAGILLAGYPLLNEGTANSCSALEKRWYTVSISDADTSLVESAVIRSLLEAGEGLFAKEYVRKQLPAIPPFVACHYYYWRSLFDEELLRAIKPTIASGYRLPEERAAFLDGEQ
jgi:hypothetical protein